MTSPMSSTISAPRPVHTKFADRAYEPFVRQNSASFQRTAPPRGEEVPTWGTSMTLMTLMFPARLGVQTALHKVVEKSSLVRHTSTKDQRRHMDTWTQINTSRLALADYLEKLSPADWNTQSLCSAWTVKQLAAHMLVVPTMSKGQVFRAFVGSGFNLEKLNAKLAAKISSEMSTAQIVEKTRSSAGSHSMPPGLKVVGALTETVVHGADISVAVGKPLSFSSEAYVSALEHLKDTNPVFKSKKRIAGLSLRATDTDWSTGAGPLVEGTAEHLLLAVAGRPAALAHLTGEGVAKMRTT